MIPVRHLGRTGLAAKFAGRWTCGNIAVARLLSSSLRAQELAEAPKVVAAEQVVHQPVRMDVPEIPQNGTSQPNESRRDAQKAGASDIKDRRPRLNNKLRDITKQIRLAVDKVEPEGSVIEAMEILEEGLSYLREVQAAERISEENLFCLFQPILFTLSSKITDTEELQKLLQIAMEHRVAHGFLVAQAMALQLPDSYQAVLQTWVRFLEYSHSCSNALLYKRFGFLQELHFRKWDLYHFTFYAYVMSCITLETPYDFRDALKLLQHDDVPLAYKVRRTLNSYPATRQHPGFETFQNAFNAMETESMDPNGPVVVRKINMAISSKDPAILDRTYALVQKYSVAYSRPISEATLTRFMNGYFECGRVESVFELFNQFLLKGITPSAYTWEIIVRSMSHPAYIKQMKPAERETALANFRRMVDTVLENNTTLSAKMLGSIVAGFANFDDLESVQQYLQKYSDQGNGTVPVAHNTKNGIVLGMLSNKHVSEANEKLKELMADGSGYVPSTLCMNAFLAHYASEKNYPAVDGILKFMSKNNIDEDVATYTTVIDLYFKLHRSKGLVPDVDLLLLSFARKDGKKSFKLNEHTYSVIINGLAVDGLNLEAARAVYNHAKTYKFSPFIVTSLLRGELDHGSIGNAQQLFDEHFKHRGDARMWNMMVRALLHKHEPLAMQYYESFKEQTKEFPQCKPNFFTHYYLLAHFLKRGNRQQVEYLLQEIDRLDGPLGTELPGIIRNLKGKYEVPEKLLARLGV